MTAPGLPPGFRRWFTIGALGVAFAAPTAHGANPPSDTPSDYAYNMPLTISGTQGVVQLRLPKALYLHARSAELNDVRVFDASGEPLPFAFQQASTRPHVSHRSLPVRLPEYFIYIGTLISFIGGLSYVRLTLQGKVQPNKLSWLLIGIATMIAFFAGNAGRLAN